MLLFVIACVVTLAGEEVAEYSIHTAKDRGAAQTVFNMSGVYQRLVASGPRPPVQKLSALVIIDQKDAPACHDLTDVCRQRKCVAKLIRGLAARSVAVIAIDKVFKAQSCDANDPGTMELKAAVQEVSGSIPIVVGTQIENESERIDPTLDFGASPLLRQGVVNLDPDNRRSPLAWGLQGADGHVKWLPTIAWEVAQAYEPALQRKYPLLTSLFNNRNHPYISFLRREDMSENTVAAREILCDPVLPCSPDRSRDSMLRGRIAIIGEVHPQIDMHASVMGMVPGVVLQANYVEALLDQRFFRPAPRWVDYVLGIALYLLFHWILVRHHQAIENATFRQYLWILVKAASWIGVIVVGTIAALYLVVMHGGWYVNPAAMGIVVIVIKFLELVFTGLPHEPVKAKEPDTDAIN